MVDSKDKPDDQIDRASMLRNMIEARVTSSNGPVKFEIEDYEECGFKKSTDFLSPRNNADSTVTGDEWRQIKAAVEAGLLAEQREVLNAYIRTLSPSKKATRKAAQHEIDDKIRGLKNAMALREDAAAEDRGVQERHSPDQRVYADIETTRGKLQRAIDSGKDINFDAEKVIGWMKLIEKETCPHTR